MNIKNWKLLQPYIIHDSSSGVSMNSVILPINYSDSGKVPGVKGPAGKKVLVWLSYSPSNWLPDGKSFRVVAFEIEEAEEADHVTEGYKISWDQVDDSIKESFLKMIFDETLPGQIFKLSEFF